MRTQDFGQSTAGREGCKRLRSPEEIAQSLRLTRTPTYRWILLQEEQRVLQEVAESIASLAKAEAEQRSAVEKFLKIQRELEEIWDKKLADEKERRDTAERELREAELALEQRQRALQTARNRVAQIRARELAPQDRAKVEQTVRDKCAFFEETLKRLKREGEDLKNKVRILEAQQADLKAQWEKVQREAEYWDSGKWPPEVGRAMEKVAEQTRAAHQKEVGQLDEEIAAWERKLSEVRAKRDNLTREIKELRREVEQDKGKCGLLHKLARFLYNPEAELASAQSRYNEIIKEESMVVRSLEQARSKRNDLMSEEGKRIDRACRDERERQYRAFVEKRNRISEDLEKCENALAKARQALQNVLMRLGQCEDDRERALGQAMEEAWQNLLAEAEKALDAAQKACDTVQQKKVLAEQNLTQAESSLQVLRAQREEALKSGLAEPNRRVTECRAECERWRHEITLRLQGCGVTLPESAQAAEIAQICTDRLKKVSCLLEQSVSNLATKWELVGGRIASSSAAPSQQSAVAEGALYLDFDRNAEDNSDPQGNPWPGLNTQLKAVLERYGKTDTPLTEQPLAWFRTAFFPDGLVRAYFVCNISYREDQPYLLIRPADITPRMEEGLPPGVTLAICGRLHDNRVDPDNPVLLVQRIVDLSHCPRRAFEREVRVTARTNGVYPGRLRRQNVLTRSFVEALPPISVETQKRLADWWDYLDWKETLAKKSLDGVRYIQVTLDRESPEGCLRFLVVAPGLEHWERVRRILRQDEVRAYSLHYSKDPWTFDCKDDSRAQEVQLGDFVTVERISAPPGDVDIPGMPWENPVWAYAVYRLTESAQEDFDQMRQEGASWERIEEAVLRGVPRQGFLSLSIVGDLALVNRQRMALKRLQEQGGYAPLLSSYLFDIQAANQPADLVPIPDDRWFRKDLNDDQKLAVRKMISAPDLALVQGPPGTGKTTMIAEAICHLVDQKKTVLVASQANLAVDNALERLVGFPCIRAIRLGQRADENCPFSESKAIATYYEAIAKTCREGILQPWEEAERTVRELREWLNQLDIVAADLAAMEQKRHSLAGRRDKILAAIDESYQAEARNRQLAEKRVRAKKFLAFLEEATDSPGELPAEIAGELVGLLAPLVQKLRSVGIDLDPEQVTTVPLPAWQQSLGLIQIFRRWQEVERNIPQLEVDAKRLAASDSESILSQGDALLMEELQRKARQLLEELAEDDTKLTDWQEVQKQIRELRKRGSGLKAEVYEAVFTAKVDGVPVVRQFTSPDARPQEVLPRLQEALRAIGEVRQEMALVFEMCRRKVTEFVNAPAPQEPLAEERRKHEIELADVTDQLASLEKELAEKEARLVELLRKNRGISEGAPTRED
ncbi:AAA domain-containing protein, partial [Thermogutta sp.]|uniref:AAA domain-containing protein n=1 Tax=Thermogutta sp. TaxID=1962930 RepID=UPI003C7E855A